jgi:DNA-damage-inducible protein D
MLERGIRPEALPAAEDIKKVESRVRAENKKLPKQTKKLGKEI